MSSDHAAGSGSKGKQAPGAPSGKQVKKVSGKVKKMSVHYDDNATLVPDQTGRPTGASAFPTRLYRSDKYDDYAKIKTGLVNSSNGQGTPFGQATLTDRDIAWLKDKRDQMQRADFEVWLTKMFNMDDPMHVQILERVYPEYFSRRLQKLEDDAQLQLRLAKIRLHGGAAVDKDDLMLIYGIQSGQVKVPKQALWRPEGPDGYSVDYQRGIFSPFKLRTPYKGTESGAFMDLIQRSWSGANSMPPIGTAAGNAGVPGSAVIRGFQDTGGSFI